MTPPTCRLNNSLSFLLPRLSAQVSSRLLSLSCFPLLLMPNTLPNAAWFKFNLEVLQFFHGCFLPARNLPFYFLFRLSYGDQQTTPSPLCKPWPSPQLSGRPFPTTIFTTSSPTSSFFIFFVNGNLQPLDSPGSTESRKSKYRG